MKIAIASGKGGTGKTIISTNLAALLAQKGDQVTYVDCDVEEPNGHLFLKPKIDDTVTVGIPTPEIDHETCDFCGKCSEMCYFNALAVLTDKVLVFPELCHGCGGCRLICPQLAIREVAREVGTIDIGIAEGIDYICGKLDVGQLMAVPIIRQIRRMFGEIDGWIILDSPPGTSCPVIETIHGADYVLLVTEPTPFGLNDLKLAVDMVRALNLPHGIIINRAGIGDRKVYDYCEKESIEIVAEIPDDRRIAVEYSKGNLFPQSLPEYNEIFDRMLIRLSDVNKHQKKSIITLNNNISEIST